MEVLSSAIFIPSTMEHTPRGGTIREENRSAMCPFHFTNDEAGIPIPPQSDPAPVTTQTAEDLAHRVAVLNDEDEVRNLQHSYGYYADRRMWTDVVDLFAADNTNRQNRQRRRLLRSRRRPAGR